MKNQQQEALENTALIKELVLQSEKEMILMGLLGFGGTVLTAVFFREHNDIILSLLFGTVLIFTGIFINRKWK